MIVLYYIIITLAAFLSSIIDTSYLSFWDISGASILLSYSILIILALFGRRKSLLFFAALTTLFYSIFSSLPVIFLLFIFFATPYTIQLIKQKIAIERNFIAILMIFIVYNFLFEAILIIISRDFSVNSWNALASFTFINTVCGLAIYYSIKLAAKYFGIKK